MKDDNIWTLSDARSVILKEPEKFAEFRHRGKNVIVIHSSNKDKSAELTGKHGLPSEEGLLLIFTVNSGE